MDLIKLDLAEEDGFSRLPRAIDAVIHVAALPTAPKFPLDAMLRCNIDGTANVRRYALAAGATRLIYTSSLSIHGRVVAPVVDETTPVVDADVYGASKYAGERLFAASADELPCVAIRLPGVLGAGAHRSWIPTLAERIVAGKPVTIYNPDASFNNAAHVDDLGRLFTGLLESRRPGFVAAPVAAAGMMTIREAVEHLMSAFGSQVDVTTAESTQPSFVVSSEFAIHNLGYAPMEIGAMLDRYAGNWVPAS